MQRLWVTVNVQEVLLPGHCGSVWMTGSPQQIVLAVPGCANGETVTGTLKCYNKVVTEVANKI
ncbi:hypothetical protein [Mediterraneibacter gnavus]|uniref:hypothetical protein n=1 Tax=Mediterraneibacter gnavus TaxID=33038 RepID=UPI0011AF257B|nr:hypothetical protein [Mediterraneibacter gnavus]